MLYTQTLNDSQHTGITTWTWKK